MSQEREKPVKRGRRYPLLFQRRFGEQVFWPCIVMLAICGALLVWDPPKLAPYRSNLIVVLVGTGLILVLTSVFRLTAYAQCRRDELRVQFPFYHLSIPYAEIKLTRPTELHHMYPPSQQRWTQRSFLSPLWSRTMVVIELKMLPRPRWYLRLWMTKYMLCPDTVGLVVPVSDWMAFRSELDQFIFRAGRL